LVDAVRVRLTRSEILASECARRPFAAVRIGATLPFSGEQDHGEVAALLHLHHGGGGVFTNVHGWGADHNVSDDGGLPDGHATYGVVGESSGPAYFIGCAFEHHTNSAFNLSGASNYTFYALQTEQTNRALVLNNSDAVLVYGTVITWSGATHDGHALAYVATAWFLVFRSWLAGWRVAVGWVAG
jgi:hypothetical protein